VKVFDSKVLEPTVLHLTQTLLDFFAFDSFDVVALKAALLAKKS